MGFLKGIMITLIFISFIIVTGKAENKEVKVVMEIEKDDNNEEQILPIELKLFNEEYILQELRSMNKYEKICKEELNENQHLEEISLIGTFEATAYTDDVQSQGKWVGQTASGIKPQVGVIAVDPKIIPLGTELYIEGYNNNKICIAGDTGGAIKGYKVDLFYDTKNECMEFGRRNIKIYRVKKIAK